MKKKSRMKSLSIKVFLSLIFAGTFFVAESLINKTDEELIPTQFSESKTEPPVTLLFTGDIMFDRGVEYQINKEGSGDFKFPLLKIAEALNGADVLVGNLEGPVSDKGEKAGSIYSFRMDPKTIDALTFAGFDVLSMANNHAFDYGRIALEDTLERLKNAGIDYSGSGFSESEAFSPIIKEVNGVKIGFLDYTNLGPQTWRANAQHSGIAWVGNQDLEKIKQDIGKAKEKTDILVVSLHAGEEYSASASRFQTDFAHASIDAGADLVIGHHPHVIQKHEVYNGKHIFYSLGNFVFDQGFSNETMQGQMVRVLIENKKIAKIAPIDIQMNSFFQPLLESDLPAITLSSEKLEQGDTLLIKVQNTGIGSNASGSFNNKTINFFKSPDSKKWLGLAGIDAKMAPGNYDLLLNLSGKEKIKKVITVVKRNFPITELAVTKELEEKGYSAEKVSENIVESEGPTLNEVLKVYTPQAYFSKTFVNPLKEIKIVGAYGNIRKSGNVSLQHLGTDLDAKINTPVFAANSGKVVFVQELPDYGKTMIIDHGLGIFSLYLHLETFKFNEGDKVKRGDIVALSGNTGYSIAPHLHFSIKINGDSVDPLRFIETTDKGW